MMFEEIGTKYESFLQDESRLRGAAQGIAFPQDAAELAAALHYAKVQGVRLTLQGARTGFFGAAVPNGGLVLNLSRMDRLLALRERDGAFFLTLQAGATLEAVESFCARPAAQPDWDAQSRAALTALQRAGRQFFPPNPTESGATLGGAFAANAAGLNALRYGKLGAHIAALEYIPLDAADCSLKREENRERIAALSGDNGQHIAVSALTICLQPRPTEAWGVLFFFETDHNAMTFAEKLHAWHTAEAPQTLCAAEYYNAAAIAFLRQDTRRDLPALPPAQAALYTELCGNDAAILEEQLLQLLVWFADCGGQEDGSWAAGSYMELEKYRKLRHRLPELLLAQPGGKIREITGNPKDFRADCAALHEHSDTVVFGAALEYRLYCKD